jgi:hypothetical protein
MILKYFMLVAVDGSKSYIVALDYATIIAKFYAAN